MILKKWIRQKYLFLYSKILKEKATPEYIARGWAIGMFYGCLVPFGLQLACSIPTSFLLKGSKIGATFGTLLTNHFTVFVIYPAQCWVGNKLMGGDLSYAKIEEAMMDVISKGSWAALLALGGELVAAFFIGAAILTAVMTPVTYFGVLHLVRRYRKAKEKKKTALGMQRNSAWKCSAGCTESTMPNRNPAGSSHGLPPSRSWSFSFRNARWMTPKSKVRTP